MVRVAISQYCDIAYLGVSLPILLGNALITPICTPLPPLSTTIWGTYWGQGWLRTHIQGYTGFGRYRGPNSPYSLYSLCIWPL